MAGASVRNCVIATGLATGALITPVSMWTESSLNQEDHNQAERISYCIGQAVGVDTVSQGVLDCVRNASEDAPGDRVNHELRVGQSITDLGALAIELDAAGDDFDWTQCLLLSAGAGGAAAGIAKLLLGGKTW